MEFFYIIELDDELSKVINSLTDIERSVLEDLDGFDFLNKLSVVLVLKGWKSEDIAKLTTNQIKKYWDEVI